jgi:hypothetical protein
LHPSAKLIPSMIVSLPKPYSIVVTSSRSGNN